jgi:hypothetical protein
MGEWMDELMVGRTDGRMDDWKCDGLVDRWMGDVLVNEWMFAWMNG